MLQIDSFFNYVKKAMPDVASTLQRTHPDTIMGWNEEPDLTNEFLYRLSKLTARDLNSPCLMTDGSVVAGTRLGGLLRRAPDGSWKFIDTKTNHTIHSVTELPGQRIFAGGEMNSLFIIDEDSNVTPFSNVGLPYGKILFLKYYDRNGLILAILNPLGLQIYATRSLVSPQWQLLQSIEQTYSFWLAPSPVHAAADDKHILLSRKDELFMFSLEDQSWTKVKAPFTFFDMAIHNGKLVALGSSWLSTKSYLSEDFGQTWQETNTRSTDSMMQLTAAGKAYVYSDDEGGMIKTSFDQGKTWYAYDKPRGKSLQLNYRTKNTMFAVNENLILFSEPNPDNASSVVFAYHVREKALDVERYVSIPVIMKYLQNKYGKSSEVTPPARDKQYSL